jgi:purine catabolism regulator
VAHAGLAVVQHIATVAALQLTMRRHREEILRREGAETLADLLQGDYPPEAITRRVVRAGFDPDGRLQLIVVRSASGLVEDDQVVRALADAGLPHLLLNARDTTYLLTRAGPQARVVLGTLPELRAGAIRPFAVGTQLGLPRREALWAAARADDAGMPFVRYGSDPIGRWTVEDPGSLRSLVSSVLGAAQAYDREHESELVRTVQTWLERERQAGPAADDLVKAIFKVMELRGLEPLTFSLRKDRAHLDGHEHRVINVHIAASGHLD